MKRIAQSLVVLVLVSGCGSATVTSPAVAPQATAQRGVIPSQMAEAASPSPFNIPSAGALPPSALPSPTSATYTVAAGDTLAGIAARLRVTVQQMLAANPGLAPSAMRIGQPLNLPPNAILPTPAPPTPSPTPLRTYPPLPDVPVVAVGHFTGPTGTPSLDMGTPIRLQFRLGGGPVTVFVAPSQPMPVGFQFPENIVLVNIVNPGCPSGMTETPTFTGNYDPLTRQLQGTVRLTEVTTISEITPGACKKSGLTPGSQTSSTRYAWTAQVSNDAERLSGAVMLGGGDQSVDHFEATITRL